MCIVGLCKACIARQFAHLNGIFYNNNYYILIMTTCVFTLKELLHIAINIPLQNEKFGIQGVKGAQENSMFPNIFCSGNSIGNAIYRRLCRKHHRMLSIFYIIIGVSVPLQFSPRECQGNRNRRVIFQNL